VKHIKERFAATVLNRHLFKDTK